MRIVLLGAPGSGKGTQGKLLAAKHKIPQISTGDLLRAAVAAGTALGRQAKAAMDAGQLVSDDIVLGIIRERLGEGDAKRGFILDGFPRNIPQAEALDRMLDEMSTPVEAALLIDVDVEVLIERLTGRRTCESCGATYNIYTSPSRMDDRCDQCGGNLRHRADDNEETISNRLRVYDQQTSPLIAYYRGQDKLKTVNGEGEIDGIFAEIEKVVRKLPAQPAAAAEPEAPSLEDLHKKVMEAASRANKKPAKPAVATPAAKAAAKPAATSAEKPAAAAAPAATAPAGKMPVKQAPAKQASAKQASAKQASAKQASAKQASAKQASAKQASAKQASAKQASAKQASAKQASAKQASAKQASAKQASAKQAPAKKAPAKKAPAKKAAAKKAAAKKGATVKKAAAKKRPVGKQAGAKKAPVSKAATKKRPAAKKAVAKKAAGKKAAGSKAIARNGAGRKGVVRKAAAKKRPAAKKTAARRPAAGKRATKRAAARRG